ncbi:hypothetical protein CY35_02G067000 [Sphagnum magellanicum]|nr:hypothetical protein CY35_02G067000 [Sphagnum magellanicum]
MRLKLLFLLLLLIIIIIIIIIGRRRKRRSQQQIFCLKEKTHGKNFGCNSIKNQRTTRRTSLIFSTTLYILSFSMASPTSLNPSSQALATTHMNLLHSCFCKFVLILVDWRQCKKINTHLYNTIKAHKTHAMHPSLSPQNSSIKLPQFSSSK